MTRLTEAPRAHAPSALAGRRRLLLTTALAPAVFFCAAHAVAQEDEDDVADQIVVTGIRSSLQSALEEKRQAPNIVEVIQAEAIGKLPDQNLAEVLENITGIQITRDAGIGQAVQIRGTDDNRIEINGVSTVGSGSGRGGVDFEDIPASLISSLEVTKVPNAKTIEGSVGGTINLRTLRPLSLQKPLVAIRGQAEFSDLADTVLPRLNGTVGNKWDTGIGEIGLVFSGSYARQDVSEFSPRVDRDALVEPTDLGPDGVTPLASAESFPFLRIQFLDQDLDNFEFETLNFTGSLEWRPNDNIKLYFDALYNDQERRQESTRVQFSGVSASAVVNNTTNTAFETVDFGSLDGPDGPVELGEVQAVLSGILEPGQQLSGGNRLNPNFRTSSNTGARVTQSSVYRVGAEFGTDTRFSGLIEASISGSDTVNPNFTTTLDFINPNDVQPSPGISLDNGVPVEFDLSNNALTFGIAQGLPTTPTTAQFLDPANYQLRQVQQDNDIVENREVAFRLDTTYDAEDQFGFFTSFDVGYRFNRTSSLNDESQRNFNFTNDGDLPPGGTGAFARPNANLFSDIVVAGPDNFDAADGRRLFVRDFLIIDPEISFSDPDAVRDILNGAITASNTNQPQFDPVNLIVAPTQLTNAFFDIEERTHAAYFQANFDSDGLGLPIRGNLGVRYVSTNVSSLGNTIIGGVATPVVTEGSYNFFLPRFNLVAEPREDVLIRAGISRDINRPDFEDLSTSVSLSTSPNDPVRIGNPDLVPEAVWSFDLSGEYYFAPSSVVTLGFFHKRRTNLFSQFTVFPPGNEDASGQLNIDITPPCEDGGFFNPIADRNINNPTPGDGICVPQQSTFNGSGTTTQTGLEFAFQHNLSEYEDRLGWASGFGVIANYTYQFEGGSARNFIENFRDTSDGPRDVFGDLGIEGTLDQNRLENLSNHAFNATLFYEKYGLSARARYTWRSSFTNQEDDFFNLFIINGSRGQLNANVNYAVTDNVTVFFEGINLLREDANQFCVNNNALLCFQGLTDRRLIVGASLRF